MTAFFAHVAGAALPVAVALLLLAAGARAALLAPLRDERARRLAREYVEPLCTWSLVAALTYAVGIGAGAQASLTTLAVLLILAAAAILLRPVDESAPDPPASPHPEPAEPAGTRAVPPRQSLWSR